MFPQTHNKIQRTKDAHDAFNRAKKCAQGVEEKLTTGYQSFTAR